MNKNCTEDKKTDKGSRFSSLVSKTGTKKICLIANEDVQHTTGWDMHTPMRAQVYPVQHIMPKFMQRYDDVEKSWKYVSWKPYFTCDAESRSLFSYETFRKRYSQHVAQTVNAWKCRKGSFACDITHAVLHRIDYFNGEIYCRFRAPEPCSILAATVS